MTGAAGKLRRIAAGWLRGRAHGVVGDRLPFPAGADRRPADDACARSARSTIPRDTPVDIERFDPGRRSGQRRRRNQRGFGLEFRGMKRILIAAMRRRARRSRSTRGVLRLRSGQAASAAAVGLHRESAADARRDTGAGRSGAEAGAGQHRVTDRRANARCVQSARLASVRTSGDAGGRGAWPAAGDARVRVLSSRQRPGPSRERVARRPAGRLHHSADGGFQERRSQERGAEDGSAERDDPGREGGDTTTRSRRRRRISARSRSRNGFASSRRRTCRNHASPDRCTCRPTTAPSRSASASSRCPKIWRARSCATRRPDLSRTCRPAASRRARRW